MTIMMLITIKKIPFPGYLYTQMDIYIGFLCVRNTHLLKKKKVKTVVKVSKFMQILTSSSLDILFRIKNKVHLNNSDS